MKVLVFGGYGFIGSYLTNFFSEKKFTIDIVVKKRSKKRNTNIIFNKLYEFNKLKLKDNYNCVFICSSKNETQTNTTIGKKDDLEKIFNNIKLLKKIERLVYISTYHCNKRPKNKASKNYINYHKSNEQKIIKFCKKNKLNYVIVRSTNLFGETPNNFIKRDTLVPYCFINEALNTKKIILKSNGKQFRDFLSLQKFSEQLYKFIRLKKYSNKKITLISNKPVKILNIAEYIAFIFKKNCSTDIKIKTKSTDYKRYNSNSHYRGLQKTLVICEQKGEDIFKFLEKYLNNMLLVNQNL